MKYNTEEMKARLLSEKNQLEKELQSIGRVNPDNPKDWEAVPANLNIDPSDPNDRADVVEEYETNTSILKELETRYNNIKRALAKIESGTYGICEIGNEEIESDRLDANPAARTCKAHIEEEQNLPV